MAKRRTLLGATRKINFGSVYQNFPNKHPAIARLEHEGVIKKDSAGNWVCATRRNDFDRIVLEEEKKKDEKARKIQQQKHAQEK